MPTMQIPIIKGDRVGLETDYRDALPVNFYAVPRKIHNAGGYLLNFSGLRNYASGRGPDRGATYNSRSGFQYRVSGNSLLRINADASVVELGTITGDDQASMPYSFNTQAIVADGKLWFVDNDDPSTFRQITDSNLGTPIDVDWIDGYYFFCDTERVYHTTLADESVIEAESFSTADFSPDDNKGVAKTVDDKMAVFGRFTIEFFSNVGGEGFAFKRLKSRALDIGIVATHAKVVHRERFFILGSGLNEDIGVFEVTGASYRRISTREIDKIIAGYTATQLSDSSIRLEKIIENGVTFIIVHLPDRTLCYNETIAQISGTDNAWFCLCSGTDMSNYGGYNFVFDDLSQEWVCGDKVNDTIASLDYTIATQYGEVASGEFFSPFVKIERSSIDEIELDIIPGFNTQDDATVAFSLTHNGITYSKEYWDMYSIPGDINKRFIRWRLGYVGDWVGFRFRTASTSRMAFSNFKLTHSV